MDLKKYAKNIPKNYVIFWGLGMILAMKINFINQKNYIRMFTTPILRCLKKNQIFPKIFHPLSNT
jgi:hypothetical protein